MININLLPAEYRKAEATPVARFIAIVVGAVVVTASLVAYGYVHYSKLKEARDVRIQTEETYANKKAQADVSKSLQTEINNYELRRKAIQSIAQNRILQSKKLDEFLDVIWARGDTTDYLHLAEVAFGSPRRDRPSQARSHDGRHRDVRRFLRRRVQPHHQPEARDLGRQALLRGLPAHLDAGLPAHRVGRRLRAVRGGQVQFHHAIEAAWLAFRQEAEVVSRRIQAGEQS